MSEASDHLTECALLHCDRCDGLLEFYTACDECGCWMNKEVEHYMNPQTGECLCSVCEPKAKP